MRSLGNYGDRFLTLHDRELCGFQASVTVIVAVKTQCSALASAGRHRICRDPLRSPVRHLQIVMRHMGGTWLMSLGSVLENWNWSETPQ